MTMRPDIAMTCPDCRQNLWRRPARDQSLLECRECGHFMTLGQLSAHADELDRVHQLYHRITSEVDPYGKQ